MVLRLEQIGVHENDEWNPNRKCRIHLNKVTYQRKMMKNKRQRIKRTRKSTAKEI